MENPGNGKKIIGKNTCDQVHTTHLGAKYHITQFNLDITGVDSSYCHSKGSFNSFVIINNTNSDFIDERIFTYEMFAWKN